jgi:hypothetical protein
MNVPRALTESIRSLLPPNRVLAAQDLENRYAEKLRMIEAEYVESGEDEKPSLGMGGLGTYKLGYQAVDSVQGNTRKLIDISWPAVCEAAERVWRNPLGEWIIRTVTSHVVGGGVHYKVTVNDKPSEEGQKRVDDFWNDPANGMDRLLPQLVQFLFVYGVQIIPCFPRWKAEGGGSIGDAVIEIGTLDPRALGEVRANPVNPREIVAVEVGSPTDRKIWRVVHNDRTRENRRIGLLPEGDKWVDEYGVQYDGACFYWRHGNAPFEKVGYPLLMRQVDYLDQADRHFFDIVERVLALQQFIWDVTIKGASTKEAIDKIAKEQGIHDGPPRPRAIRYHNDNITWQAVTPNLGMSDITPLSRNILLFVLGSAGIPLHWFGEGENTNRASAESMARPTRKLFEALQDEVRWYVEDLLGYVIDTAVLAKKLPDVEYKIAVEMPQVAVADTASDATTLKTIGDAMQVAIGAGILTEGQAAEIYKTISGQIGIEVRELTPEEKKEIADKKEAAEKMAADNADKEVPVGKSVGKPVKSEEKPGKPEEGVQESYDGELEDLPPWLQAELSKPSDLALMESERLDGALNGLT